MNEVVIVSAARTAVGSFNGALASVSAVELGAVVIKAVLERAGIGAGADEVIMGNVLQAGLRQNPARQAAVHAGLPVEIPSVTINKLCGSGLKAVALAAQAIRCGDAECIIAGGMENMSQAPYLLKGARWGYRMGDGKIVDSLLEDGLSCAFNDYHMGMTAENVAVQYAITREDQDRLACASQAKACAAIQSGAFKREIVPVTVKGKKGDVLFETDEYPREGVTIENLAKLRPAFKSVGGTVTAGNASGINDGAAAVLLMSAAKAETMRLKPIARIVGYASGGVDPSVMGLGPIPATRNVLAKTGLSLEDMDLVEANEAFAAQFLAVGKELGFSPEKVNVNGGAIALGHPIGASGARILVTLLHALEARGGKRGLATLCIGGGQGVAVIVERL